MTVHAPQSPSLHTFFAPVRPSDSRRVSRRLRCGGTWTETSRPFTLRERPVAPGPRNCIPTHRIEHAANASDAIAPLRAAAVWEAVARSAVAGAAVWARPLAAAPGGRARRWAAVERSAGPWAAPARASAAQVWARVRSRRRPE